MIGPTQVFRAPESASPKLDVQTPGEVKLLVSFAPYLLICVFVMPGAVAAQAPREEYAQNYHEPFKGQPRHVEDLTLIGADAGTCVKFEPEGLRITLPPGKKRPSTGLATAFGATGDFEITIGYEILHEPEPADAGEGGGTRISLTVNLNRLGANGASIRRKVTTTQKPHILAWRTLKRDAVSPPDELGARFPVKAKTGRFRLVRTGTDLAYYVSEGADKEFTLLQTFSLGADDVKDIQIFGSSGSETASLDARFTDLRISAASLPRKPAPPKIDNVSEPKMPAKDYAQTYYQSFKGSGARPDGWNFASRLSEACVQFEQAGLRVTLPPGGPEKGQSAGIVSDFGVKGDFEITLTFEALKDPEPADVGKGGTRLSLSVVLDTPLLGTPQQEVATLNRSMASKGFLTWARNRHDPTPLMDGFPTPATTGRLRLVRSGDELFYLASVGVDQPFTFLTKYRFGAEELKRIAISGQTGGAKAMLDVRVTDFGIRADAIPGGPTPEVAVDPQHPAAPPPERRRGWLLAGLVLALTLVAIFALGFFLRKRGGAARQTSANAAAASVSFACPKCAKVLKTRAEMAGKKVKCAQCGTAVLVPSIQVT